MKHRPLAAFIIAAALPFVALSPTSCADSNEAHPEEEDASTIVQPPPVDAAPSDVIDAAPPCDAGDPTCVSTLLTCAQADFCPVPSTIDPRFVLRSVWGTSANDVWAVGSGGTILHWDGASYKTIPSGTLDTLEVVWASGPNDIWIAGSSATILHGAGLEGGVVPWASKPAFTGCALAFPGRLHAVWGPSAGEVRLGGERFACFDSDVVEGNLLVQPQADAGAGWTVQAGLDGKWTYATVRAAWGSSASDQWISLDNGMDEPWARGTLVHGTAAGTAEPLVWTSVDSQSNVPLESLWGSSSIDVWAVGAGGTVRRYAAGAKHWTSVDVPTTNALHAVWGTGPADVWVVGDAGTILHFDGAAWTAATVAFPLGRKPNLEGVWGSSHDDVWVVGEAFTLHYTGRKGAQ